jgi:hypothetical protein
MEFSTARGTRFKENEERRAQRARESARLWKVIKAAVRVLDGSRPISRGVYEIPPEAMISMRHECEGVRHMLAQQEAEMKAEGE